jgi:hypothetical protein
MLGVELGRWWMISSMGGTPATEPAPVKVVKDAKAMLEAAVADG